MKTNICIIGSRTVIPQMTADLITVLNDIADLEDLHFTTGGCDGVSLEAIKFLNSKDLADKLTIWLPKKVEHSRLDLRPYILEAIYKGANVVEGNAQYYLHGLIQRNRLMLEACDACYAFRLDNSKGTTHEIKFAEHFKKPVNLFDYRMKTLDLFTDYADKNSNNSQEVSYV